MNLNRMPQPPMRIKEQHKPLCYQFCTLLLLVFSFNAFAQPVDCQSFQKTQEAAWDLMFSDPQQAIIKLVELQQQSLNYPDSHRVFAFNSLAVCNSILGNNQRAHIMMDSALQISGNDPRRINLLLNKGMLFIHSRDFQNANEILSKAKTLAQELENYAALQTVYEELATIYGEYGNFEGSMEMLYKSKELNSKMPETDVRATLINKQKIGNLYLKMKKFAFAEKLIGEAAAGFKETQMMDAYYTALIGYCDALHKLEQFNQLDSLLTVIVPEVAAFGNTKLLAFYYSIHGNFLLKKGQIKQANQKFEAAYEIYSDAEKSIFYAGLFVQYLNFLVETNAINQAFALYTKHQSAFETLNYNYSDRIYYHTVFYKIFEKLGDLETAIWHLVKMDELHDSIDFSQEWLTSKVSASQYFVDYYENKLFERKSQLAAVNGKLCFAVGAIVLLLLLLVGLITFFLRKEKRHLKSQLQKDVAAELVQAKFNNLLKIVDNISKSGTSEIPEAFSDLVTNNLNSNTTDYGDGPLGLDKQLEVQQKALNMHHKMVAQLMAIHPTLSAGDTLLCALLASGMSTKEIGQVLDINPQSVATKKMRLTRKLNLESASELRTYLKAL